MHWNGVMGKMISHWIWVFPLFLGQRCDSFTTPNWVPPDDWIPGLTFVHWDGWKTKKIYSENSLILSQIYFWLLLVIRTFAWPGEVARIACCSRRCADCQWNVRPHEFGTKSPCVILMLDGVDQTGWKCWILQELHYCSMNNRSEEALWWNKPAPNLVLGILPKLLLHFGKETVLIDADSFYESLTFADANSKWECDFIWSS